LFCSEAVDFLNELFVDPNLPDYLRVPFAHYHIHLMERSATPEAAEASANLLPYNMVDTGHAVHMPFHILARIGRNKEAMQVNIASVEKDRQMFEYMG
jgi:hypothetical protein